MILIRRKVKVDNIIRKNFPFLYPNRTLAWFFVTSANWWCGHFQFSSIAFQGVAIGKDTRPLIPYMKNFPLKLANPQFNNGYGLFVCIFLWMCRINYIRQKIWTMLIEYTGCKMRIKDFKKMEAKVTLWARQFNFSLMGQAEITTNVIKLKESL